jgi:hypothetical protein
MGISAQVSAENMIGLSESTKCAVITEVSATTLKSERLQISTTMLC